jgi:hypothetical protein
MLKITVEDLLLDRDRLGTRAISGDRLDDAAPLLLRVEQVPKVLHARLDLRVRRVGQLLALGEDRLAALRVDPRDLLDRLDGRDQHDPADVVVHIERVVDLHVVLEPGGELGSARLPVHPPRAFAVLVVRLLLLLLVGHATPFR